MSNFTLSETHTRPGKAGVSPITIGYWNIRGLGAGVRQLCEYLEVPYEDVRYNIKPLEDGGYNFADSYKPWQEYKVEHREDFPFHLNLPYLVDGETKLVQTRAVLYYIARKFGRPSTMGGDSPADQAHHYRLMETIADINNNAVQMYYGHGKKPEEFPAAMEKFTTGNGFKKFLEDFQAQIGTKKFLFSETELAVADITAYEFFDTIRLAHPSVEYPQLVTKFLESFEAVPAIAAYRKSADYIPFQCNNKIAVHQGIFKK